MNQNHYPSTIKEIPSPERPYEKCKTRGVTSLSDLELLAVLLRTGTRGESALTLAGQILYGQGDEGLLRLHQLSLGELTQIKGIGEVKAIQILCLSELARRLSKAEEKEFLSFSSPETIANYYMEDMRHLKQEHLKLLLLDTKTRLIGEKDISIGTVNSALITPRELFIEALKMEAVAIILLHNHPSGDPSPSRDDEITTERILKAGELIGIELLDHIVIGSHCYVSFREKGLL